ncbi:GTPase HflX [Aquibaculum arenosum]|uniref:GTPase HflX n=1 Tax=Aquibaculum arenosum TaxID=3032591 RepID=A0ABT5YMN6_9PROT|nr:GTPase HflX [Fodinicurvata sp. CAU 1616]MDF2096185.1 GTPase HflX [Fodinicurvata sp. CAU 1616]
MLHPAVKPGPGQSERSADARLQEAIGLAQAIGLEIVGTDIAPLDRPNPATFVGGGVVERLSAQAEETEADLVVFDCMLSPGQQRNLERALNRKVIDRTGLILEIFGARARTKEGRLQVDLAALTYQRSRLVRSWTHLERQRSGGAFMGGPGERQIELDRRMLDEKIIRLKKDLEQVKRTRGLHRSARQKVPYPVVALVGYTNAGKSTLFNTLTRADVMAEDMLFATLDPTMRRLELASGETIILSDTVGFITDLPVHLVAAFRATLEEVISADVIVHVRDVSDPEHEEQKASVDAIMQDLGLGPGEAGERPVIEVFNKIDLLEPEARAALQAQCARDDHLVAVSALKGEGLPDLLEAVRQGLQRDHEVLELEVDAADGKTLAWLYQHGQVLDREEGDGHTWLRVSLSPIERARFDRLPIQQGEMGPSVSVEH